MPSARIFGRRLGEIGRAVSQRLTFDAAWDSRPAWSPDGEEVTFRSLREATAACLDGTHWEYDVSADGRFVMVEDVVAEGESQHKPATRITQNWFEQFRNREQDRAALLQTIRAQDWTAVDPLPASNQPSGPVFCPG